MPDVKKKLRKEKNSNVYYIKFIIRKMPYIVSVELDSRKTNNHAYPYLLTIVDHFSKYGFAYAIPDKKSRNN